MFSMLLNCYDAVYLNKLFQPSDYIERTLHEKTSVAWSYVKHFSWGIPHLKLLSQVRYDYVMTQGLMALWSQVQ